MRVNRGMVQARWLMEIGRRLRDEYTTPPNNPHLCWNVCLPDSSSLNQANHNRSRNSPVASRLISIANLSSRCPAALLSCECQG